jgi:hypothetical protein
MGSADNGNPAAKDAGPREAGCGQRRQVGGDRGLASIGGSGAVKERMMRAHRPAVRIHGPRLGKGSGWMEGCYAGHAAT